MGKIYLLGDSHIGLGYPNNTDKWEKVHKEYFSNFLIPFLKENVTKDDIIIHLGDLFDNRNVIPINLLNYAMNIVEEISQIGRNTQGVKVMRVSNQEKVVSIVCVKRNLEDLVDEENEDEGQEIENAEIVTSEE